MDKSGIYSQRGFVYQVEVYIYHLLTQNDGATVSYEYLDDISIQSAFDEQSGAVKGEATLVQVKHTSITQKDVVKIFLNWTHAALLNSSIKQFILYQAPGYEIHESFRTLTAETFLEIVQKEANTHKRGRGSAVVSKFCSEEIKAKFNFVKENSEPIQLDAISALKGELKHALHYGAVDKATYEERIQEVRGRIKAAIADKILNAEPFHMSIEDLMKICEDVCSCISQEKSEPSFTSWRAENPGRKIEDMASKREVIQLKGCFGDISKIVEHIYYCDYYSSLRFRKLERCQAYRVDDLEDVTYANFLDARDKLNDMDKDTPRNRLRLTKASNNSYCANEHEQWGSCIYLTKDDAPPQRRISWLDEEE